MARGRRIHNEIEAFVTGKTEVLPSAAKKTKEIIEFCRDRYAEGKATAEEKWGFTGDWSITGWFDGDIWLRLATDCFVSCDNDAAIVFDWKSGKSFGNEVKLMQQMQLYACATLMKHPEINFVDTKLVFVDDGTIREKHFERGTKINALIARFTERGNRMINCVDFRPSPNLGNCRYCPYGTMNGTGACMHAVSNL